MAKKKPYKKVFKGVRYIEGRIKKYFGKRYPDAKSRKDKAHELYALTAGAGQRVNLANIFELERHHRPKKPPGGGQKPPIPPPEGGQKPPKPPGGGQKPPKIYSELRTLNQYYTLIQYPNWIQFTVKDVWFFSPSIFRPGAPDIQGGTTPDYGTYFRDFVNFCNRKAKEMELKGSDEMIWYVKCKEPQPSQGHPGQWESEIIVLNEEGEEEDFGYDPSNPGGGGQGGAPKPPKPPKPPGEPGGGAKPPSPPSGPTDNEVKIAQAEAEKAKAEAEKAKAEAEKEKSSAIKQAMDMLAKGQITEDTFKFILGKV